MPLSHIEHYLVAADDMERTRDWYRDVLGMQEGWHPDFGFPVYWMYLDGVDVVHIGRSAKHASDNQKTYLGRLAQDSGAGTGAIDHIAFRARGLKETMAHLRRHKIEFSERRANGQALYQLFSSAHGFVFRNLLEISVGAVLVLAALLLRRLPRSASEVLALRPALALSDREHFGHLIKIGHLNGTMRAQDL